ncbi:hypothetical protein [Paenibacillus sp. YAF4_2]|uniref:hypothetical protein n=1 Tax=Paenibacillus sp. YAF4_2 TaxID=3233085 RepID=UPI003F9E7015
MKKWKASIPLIVLIVVAALLLGTNVFSTADQTTNLDSIHAETHLADVPAIKLQKTVPSVEQEKAVPASLSAIALDESEITSYKEFDTGITQNATVSFVDPLHLGNDDTSTSRAGDHRVYKKTVYAIDKMTSVAISVGPIDNQKFIVSAAKGHSSSSPSQNVSVTGALSIKGTYNSHVIELVKAALNLSASGTASKAYTATDTWTGPPEGSAYNSRDYYGGINYDQYDITIVKYYYYDEYIGTTFVGTTSEIAGYTYLTEVLKPKNIVFCIDHKV